jgi:hypothetical protein
MELSAAKEGESHEPVNDGAFDEYMTEVWFKPFREDLNPHRGLSFRIQDDRHYGNCFPFLYLNGEPLCLIGPDCRCILPREVLVRDSCGSIPSAPKFEGLALYREPQPAHACGLL